MAVGLAVSAMGALIVLLAVGVIPGGDASLEAPRWVVAAAGLSFVLAGAAIIVGYAVAGGAAPDGDLPPGTPRWLRVTQSLLGLGIIVSLAAVGTWVAFGIGAVLMWIFLVVFVVVSVQRIRRNR